MDLYNSPAPAAPTQAPGVPSRTPGGFLGSRVARRVFLVFVLAALVPLAVSDWLATAAVTQLVRSQQVDHQKRTVRQTGLQVYDRLLAAKTLLATLPGDAEVARWGANNSLPTNAERIFRRLVYVDATGQVAWPPAARTDLPAAWAGADHGAPGPAPEPFKVPVGSLETHLRILARNTDEPRILMATTLSDGRPHWLGELRADHLWGPVAEAAVDSGWRVLDASGRSLSLQGDMPLMPAALPQADSSAELLLGRTELPLASEFAASPWTLLSQRDAPIARWKGMALGHWLALVAAATVAFVALLSQRLIRRLLVPLERLTEGTRRLAAGEVASRVAVESTDEFGKLGEAFNHMASRIQLQFDALAGLAAVDRDVLDGAPLERVVGRVLEDLARFYPDVGVAVSWLDPARPRRLCQLVRKAGQKIDTELLLVDIDALQADRLGATWSDHVLAPTALECRQPWCTPANGPEASSMAILPLRWGDTTQALMVLGLPQGTDTLVMKAAGEWRDRLAVAFSAREREREMAWRATHDSLTGLANRSGLGDYLDALLQRQDNQQHAVLFVDLDHFKDANDSLGHAAGDSILCEMGRRLTDCAGPHALVARQGGDEFVMVLPQVNAGASRAIAERVVSVLGEPFELRGERHQFGGSVGIARYPQHGRTRDDLLRHADIAMYAAKESGRNRYALFDESLELAAQERLRVPRELRRDLELGKMVGHYQARVRPSDGCITSVEALVRWQHPERGLLMPGAFIALAEESSLIEDLGTWMINEACARMTRWRRQHPSLQRVSVNVSPRQLMSGELVGHVRSALSRHGLPASALELEVTESLLVTDASHAYVQLSELRDLGVCIALDDFGTGFSSMAMLSKLPIDVMKIDRAFVKNLGQDPAALAIVRSIAELAHSLRLHLVAEGIETEEQATLLGALGCDEFQGFLYSKPLPPAEFSHLCAERGGWLEAPASGFLPISGVAPSGKVAPLAKV